MASDPAADAVPVGWPGVAKILNAMAFEVPPPSAGVTPVICAVPEAAISAAEIAAAPPVVPTNKVVRLLPFHCSPVHGVQLVPLIPSRKAGFPAAVFDGVSEIIVGAGRESGAAIVKVEELDVVVGLETVTAAVP